MKRFADHVHGYKDLDTGEIISYSQIIKMQFYAIESDINVGDR